jgi:hypothetical protein
MTVWVAPSEIERASSLFYRPAPRTSRERAGMARGDGMARMSPSGNLGRDTCIYQASALRLTAFEVCPRLHSASGVA